MALGEKPPASNGRFARARARSTRGASGFRRSLTGRASSRPPAVNEPLHMVDVMPTLLALAGGKGSVDHPFDGKDIWATLADGKPTPHDEILINVEAFRAPFARATGSSWHGHLPGKDRAL